MSVTFARAFHAAHARLYGYADRARGVEVVNLRVAATAKSHRLPRVRVAYATGAARPHRVRWNGRWLNGSRRERETLRVGKPVSGPLLVTELSATTFVPPGWRALLLPLGDLMLERRSQPKSGRSTRDLGPRART